MSPIAPELIAELDPLAEPGALLAALHKRFGPRMAIGTAGQLSGSVLVALAAEAGIAPRVFTVDTGRLFPETLALFGRLEKKYGVTIERFAPDATAVQKMTAEHGEYLFFDAKEKQELCCHVRKVLPNSRALDTLDVWVTGLRADQSRSRAGTPRFRLMDHGGRPLLKVAPLVDWTEATLREYIGAHGVPVNELLERKLPGGYYYESLGCVICTTPIGPGEPRRAGRWRWFNDPNADRECGLHVPPPPEEDSEP
jgi:phosphoadenosine phosphosulfate reductase